MFTLTADEVAQLLDVSPQTIYAYVSRGKIRAERTTGKRASLYHAGDVQRLVENKKLRNSPGVVADALHWGTPLLETEISTIHDGHLFYRGHAAEALVDASFESVVALLWQVDEVDFAPVSKALREPIVGARSSPFLHACTSVTGAFDAIDETAFGRSDAAIIHCALTALRGCSDLIAHRTSRDPIARRLASAWGVDADLIDAALVLCADHEINVSTFTCRCIASTHASPYAAVCGGLNAMKGPRHGGTFARIAALCAEANTPHALLSTIRDRIMRGDAVPGFGHPLYPDGDERALLIFERHQGPWLDAVFNAGTTFDRDPTIDLVLFAMFRDLGAPDDAALAVFVLSRIAGWIAHYREQLASGRLIRPRARYVGAFV